jgi:hypothetical protein
MAPHLVFAEVCCQLWVMHLQQCDELAYGGLDATGAVVQLLTEVVPAQHTHVQPHTWSSVERKQRHVCSHTLPAGMLLACFSYAC